MEGFDNSKPLRNTIEDNRNAIRDIDIKLDESRQTAFSHVVQMDDSIEHVTQAKT